MEPFVYSNPVKLIYGAKSVDRVGEEIKPFGKRVLFHYGMGHIRRDGTYERVIDSMQRAGLSWVELPGVHPNPKLDLVEQGVELFRKEGCDFILGVGGGSVSDSTKAIAMGVNLEYDVWSAYEDFHHIMHGGKAREFPHIPTGTVPFGVVMTKAGTGSDFDYTSVLSNVATQEKLMVISKVLYPKFSIHDPELTYTLPRREIACGTADIMTHVLEQYLTRSTDTEILDHIKEGNLRTVVDAGRRAFAAPDDYAAQSYLLYCAAWACSDQTMCGALGGWAGHMMEHEVSAVTDMNHGQGMAIIYLPWMRSVLDSIPEKFAQYGENVWGIERDGRSDRDIGAEAIDRTAGYWAELGLALTWEDAGVDVSFFPRAAKQAVRFGELFSINELGEKDVLEILNAGRKSALTPEPVVV